MNSRQVKDYYPELKAAIAEAKTVGLETAASKLEARAFAARTTSSEMLGEHGRAILEFLDAGGSAVPASVKKNLAVCLNEIGRVWPKLPCR